MSEYLTTFNHLQFLKKLHLICLNRVPYTPRYSIDSIHSTHDYGHDSKSKSR